MHHDYGGAMAKQSQTLAGLWSTVTDTFQQGMAKALIPLEPILRKVLPKATEIMGKALAWLGRAFASAITWVTVHWPQIQSVFSAVWDFIKPILAALGAGVMWLKDHVIAPVVTWIVEHWPQIKGAFSDVVTYVKAHWPEVESAINAAYQIGEAEDEFARTLAGAVPFVRSGTLGAAIEAAAGDAARSPTKEPAVLLSPACASFDQFANFEARGDAFRALVAEWLARGRAPEKKEA